MPLTEPPTISIIVPVYRVEEYLCRCVDSLLDQTFHDLEIILVDDGSDDGCPLLCDRYAAADRRIRVIHKENGGLSDARNAGLDAASGEYIGFVDSDDWVKPAMFGELLAVLREYDADIACCGFIRVNDGPGTTPHTVSFGGKRVITGTEAVREILYDNDAVVVWNKLYKAELFRDVRFPAGLYHEDNAVFCRTVGAAGKVAFTGTIGYCYRVRKDSIMRSGSAALHEQGLEYAAEEVRRYTAGRPELTQAFRCYETQETVAKIKFYLKEKPADIRKVRSLTAELRKGLLPFLADRKVRRMAKLEAFLAAAGAYRSARALWRALGSLRGRAREYAHEKARDLRLLLYRLKGFIRYPSDVRNCGAVLFGTPLHANLGDHAIALAETNLLASLGIKTLDFPWFSRFPALLTLFTPKDRLILISGGGYMGSLWERNERNTRRFTRAFRNYRILILPQTVYFDLNTEEQRQFLAQSAACYTAHPDLTLFVREAASLAFIQREMPDVRVRLVPDMAMLPDLLFDADTTADVRFQTPQPEERKSSAARPHAQIIVRTLPAARFPHLREGALVCLRDDCEKLLGEEEKNNVLSLLQAHFRQIRETDTIAPHSVLPWDRAEAVREKLAEFAGAELAVTDRLHGMVFAAITGTPCIVLDSRSPKIKGCYEWIKETGYIRFAGSAGEIPSLIDELRKVHPVYCRDSVVEAMAPLFDELKSLS